MNNIVKNLLLALTLVCVIALIVFCIQLIVINRGGDTGDAESVVSGDAQEDGDETSTDGDDETTVPPGIPQLPQGTRHQITVTTDSRLIVYAREDLFDFETGGIDFWSRFIYRGIGEARLELSFESISPLGMAVTAEAFLNNYSGDTASVVSGEEYIRGSSVRGYHVSTLAAGGIYEAWIHNLVDSDLALVFVIFYENDTQRDALYEVLSTLDIERVAVDEPFFNDQDDQDDQGGQADQDAQDAQDDPDAQDD